MDYKNCELIGGETEIKFFRFRNVHFFDLYTLLGKAMSLQQACKAFNTVNFQKKESLKYDFEKIATWSDVEINIEEISIYNKNDVVILEPLHNNLV
jgi:hypothetical protein